MPQYLTNVVTLQLSKEKCTGCGICVTVCPHAVFAVDNGKAKIVDRDNCMECGACARNCPVAAVTVSAGVGCATAVISAALGNTDACCCETAKKCC